VGRLLLALLRALPGAAATAVLLLQQTQVWPQAPKDLIVAAILVLAFMSLAGPVTDVVFANRRQRRETRRRRLDDILRQALMRITDRASVRPDAVGLHLYVLPGRARARLARPKPQLTQVTRLRLSSTPEPSDIKWSKGKGVVGECWATRIVVRKDLSPIQGAAATVTELEWRDLPLSFTLGLSYAEMRLTAPKYGCVVAVPVVRADDGQLLGCLTLDGESADFASLASEPVVHILSDAAQSAAGHLAD
jgi:hypothetical protein